MVGIADQESAVSRPYTGYKYEYCLFRGARHSILSIEFILYVEL
jgi:hypothetical protein